MRKVKSQKSGVRSKKQEVRSKKKSCLLPLTSCLLLLLTLLISLAGSKQAVAAENIKVAIVPWKINAAENLGYLKGAVYDMLISRIGAEPAIEIVKESSLQSALSRYGQEAITEDMAKNIGKDVDADYVIYGSITVIADSISIDARTVALKKVVSPIFFASQGKGLDNIISLVDEMTKDAKAKILNAEGITTAQTTSPASSEYTGKFIAKEKPAETLPGDDFIIKEKTNAKGIWKSPQFDTDMKQIDIADIDGDGKNEIAVIDNHNLFIYRLKGQTLEIVKEFKGDVPQKNYSISIADINNNGMPEIYVTRIANDRLNSYVLEYRDGEFKAIASDLKWFLRVLKDPKTGPVLMGQKYSDITGFFGIVQKLEWKDGKPQEIKGADIPKDLNLYNFEMADLDRDGAAEIIALDARDYLHIYKRDEGGSWNDIWKSGEFYGGSLNRLEIGTSSTNQEASDYIDIKTRIVYTEIYGDGLGEIIISKNDPGALGRYFKVVRSYDRGEIIDLIWGVNSLEENWRTKKIDGYIADYGVNDIDNDGQKELVIVVVMDGGRGKSYIMAYKLQAIGKGQ